MDLHYREPGECIEVSRDRVSAFVRESNYIEGIHREPTDEEVTATRAFLMADKVDLNGVEHLVSIYAPRKPLREFAGMNVRVGDYIAPPGGPEIRKQLLGLLNLVNSTAYTAWECHVEYERLHPFMDGNGRSGRAIWAWQMLHQGDGIPLGFLHHFYYQTLRYAGVAP